MYLTKKRAIALFIVIAVMAAFASTKMRDLIIEASTINSTTIGATTPSTGAFTTSTASTSYTSPQFKSNSANPAASGIVRLATGDCVAFRNNANSGDITLCKNASDEIVVATMNAGTSILAPFFKTKTANGAASGILRLATGDTACWRNNANAADICISKNASDVILFPSGITVTGTAQADQFQTTANRTLYKQASTRVFNSAGQLLTTGVLTTITWDTENWDTDSLHSTSSNTSRLTASVTGKWQVNGCFEFAANNTGYRELKLFKNGNTGAVYAGPITQPLAGVVTRLCASVQVDLAAGDYIEMGAFQNSGGNLTGTTVSTFLDMALLGNN